MGVSALAGRRAGDGSGAECGGEQAGQRTERKPGRGLANSDTAPMMGAPIGVLPLNVTAHSAITRPRKLGSLVSCSVLLPVAMNAVPAAPRVPSPPARRGASAR